MLRLIARRIATTLVLSTLGAVAAWGQTTEEWTQLLSTEKRAKAFKARGDERRAAKEYEQALEFALSRFGGEHRVIPIILNNLANAYFNLGRLADAEPHYKR